MKIYLASPYSHYDKRVMENRYLETALIAGILINDGYIVYSPIVHNHTIAKVYAGCGLNYEYWRKMDEEMMNWCDSMFIEHITDDIFKSKGIREEVKYIMSLNKPIARVMMSKKRIGCLNHLNMTYDEARASFNIKD